MPTSERGGFARVEPWDDGDYVVTLLGAPFGEAKSKEACVCDADQINAAFAEAVAKELKAERERAALIADAEDATGWIGKQIRSLKGGEGSRP